MDVEEAFLLLRLSHSKQILGLISVLEQEEEARSRKRERRAAASKDLSEYTDDEMRYMFR